MRRHYDVGGREEGHDLESWLEAEAIKGTAVATAAA
jgi:hypothetical protein